MKSQTIKYESYQLSNKSNAGNRIYDNFHFLTIYVTKAGTVGEQSVAQLILWNKIHQLREDCFF